MSLLGARDARAQRVAPGDRFVLELDGAFCGWVGDVAGGDSGGDKAGGTPAIADLSFSFGAGMCRALYAWIGSSLGQSTALKAGVVVRVGPDGVDRERLAFQHAKIAQVKLPRLDATTAGTGRVVLVLSPQQAQRTQVAAGAPVKRPAAKQHALSTAKFHVGFGDGVPLPQPVAVEPLTVPAYGPSPAAAGKVSKASAVKMPALQLAFGDDGKEALSMWALKILADGKLSESETFTATLEYEDAASAALFTLTFEGTGLQAVEESKKEAGKPTRRVAQLSSKAIHFAASPAASKP